MGLEQKAARIGKLSAIYAMGSIAKHLIAMLLLPVFTSYLVPAQMGILGLAGRVIGPVAILIQAGLWSALKIRYFQTEESQRPLLVRTVLIGQVVQMGVFCSLLSLGGIWAAGHLLPNLPLSAPKVVSLWLMVVWSCFFSALIRMASGLSELHERALTSVGINLFQFLVQTVLGIVVVVWLGWQGFGRQSMIFLAMAVTGVLALRIIWRYGKGGFDSALFRKILRVGLTFVPHGLAGVLALAINGWLLNKLVSPAALGIYGIALSFASLLQLPLHSFGNAAYPTLAKLMADGGQESRRQQSRLYTLLIAGIAALSLGITLFAPVAIRILTVPAYHEAVSIVPILVLAWLLQGLYWLTANRVSYFSGGLWLATATVFSLAASVALGFVLIPPFGAHGAAMALAGCFFIRFLVVAVVGGRIYPLPWQFRAIVGTIVGVVLLAVADVLLSPWLGIVPALLVKTAFLAAVIPLMRIVGVASGSEMKRGWQLVLAKMRSLVGRR